MSTITRRDFLEATTASLAVATTLTVPSAADVVDAAASNTVPRTALHVKVNGVERTIEVEDRWTLVEVLRDHLELTGTKIGCDRGECGACTVLLNGRPVYSCSYLAVWAQGATVETVEGLARGDRLDPLQTAFVEHDGPQCGFCTSGQLMAAKALLTANPHPTVDEVRAGMSGNICRCSNYNRYVEAVLAASQTPARSSGGGQ
jgi:xanthine dehydrogenase YagT iron-sulfur-binding subunit